MAHVKTALGTGRQRKGEGAVLSPLHDRFETTLYAGAMAEAAALTAEKVRLENLEVDTCVGMVDHPTHSLGS